MDEREYLVLAQEAEAMANAVQSPSVPMLLQGLAELWSSVRRHVRS